MRFRLLTSAIVALWASISAAENVYYYQDYILVTPDSVSLDFSDVKTINKFGANYEVSLASDPEDVWEVGGTMPIISAAAACSIRTVSADDTSGGSGARTIRVFGLSGSYGLMQKDLTLEGDQSTLFSNDPDSLLLDVYRLTILTAGSNRTNVDSVQAKIGNNVVAAIGPNRGQSTKSAYIIPAGYSGFLTSWRASVGKGTNSYATIELYGRQHSDPNSAWAIKGTTFLNSTGGEFDKHFDIPSFFPEKTSGKITVREVSANNTAIQASFTLLLIKNGS